MTSQPLAVVLGGTTPHIALINRLKRRGYRTLLVDYLVRPPASPVADEHIRASTLDHDAVLEISRQRKAQLVITTCVDQANVTACYVAERLGLPAPYDYQTALEVTDKRRMKARFQEFGIQTARHRIVNNTEDSTVNDLSFPLIVKPADSNGSKGVRMVGDQRDLARYLADALTASRCGEAIVEEYITGQEIGIDCYVQGGHAHVVMIKDRRKALLGKDPTPQICGCTWPAQASRYDPSQIDSMANQVANAFGLRDTPLMIQAVCGERGVYVLELGARVGGGESFRIIKLSTGFDYLEAAIDSFLGQPVVVNAIEPTALYADNFIYAQPCVFGRITGAQALIDHGCIEYMDEYRTSGTRIGAELSGNNRVGVFVACGETHTELRNKVAEAIQILEVLDVHGKASMRKDIYQW